MLTFYGKTFASRLLIAAEPTIRTAIGPILGLLFGGTVPHTREPRLHVLCSEARL